MKKENDVFGGMSLGDLAKSYLKDECVKKVPENDPNKIGIIFNQEMSLLFDKIERFFDFHTARNIFPEIYDYMYNYYSYSLAAGINRLKFLMYFSTEANYIVNLTIKKNELNIFQEGFLLSKGKFDNIQQYIILNDPATCMGIASKNNTIKKETKAKFKLSGFKTVKEINSLVKEIFDISIDQIRQRSK